MRRATTENFGVVIAYLLPGAAALWGVGYFSDTVRSWFGAIEGEAPSIGGFLYVTLAAIGAGLIVSAIRWVILDRLYHRTGISPPAWNFSTLPGRLNAFEGLVENHYRYYQFYANLLVAVTFSYLVRLWKVGFSTEQGVWPHLGLVALATVLVLGSRDSLRKYYSRAGAVLGGGRR